MSLYAQALLDVHDELIVDLFAGGGGASSGIEQGLGRMVDIAINHNAAAVAMHQANHPQTKHLVSDVFEVDPRYVCDGRKVGLLWASPDCTFHSKARGKKPIRSATKKRRALAWIVTRWAGQVRPRVIMLENVEEFAQWGPLVGKPDELRPCKKRRGKTFKAFVRSLKELGYAVEWKELRACDYGAPTIRKRLFLIARCDGQPIVWPAPSHGQHQGLKPYRTAAECIDWSIPMLSIFATKEEARAWGKAHNRPSPIRPLADKSMERIARGVKRFVLDNPKPFIVPITHTKSNLWPTSVEDPLKTITTAKGGELAVCAPCLVPRYGEAPGQEPRCRSVDQPYPTVVEGGNGGQLVAANLIQYHSEMDGNDVRATNLDRPIPTLDCANRHGLVATFLAQNNGGFYEGAGRSLEDPLGTILTESRGHHGLVAAHIQRDFGTSTGSRIDAPIGTLTCEGNGKAALVYSFLSKYYGEGLGQLVSDPIHTIATKDRFGVVTLKINGVWRFIDDIAMRMLTPRELYRCQGFRDNYIIDRGADGIKLSLSEQVHMCGNSVSPVIPEALVVANLPDLIVRTRPVEKKRKVAA
jgi:DNA (cytosine-5)-methyltransferase 1